MHRLLERLWWWRQGERELDEEIRAHLEIETERQMGLGLPEPDARRAARKAFGNVGLAREDSRAVWSFTSLESWLADLRYGARAAARNRAFTLVAALSLALGIGANVALFRIVDAVLLRPLPVSHPEQLLLLEWTSGNNPLAQMIFGNLSQEAGGVRSTSFSTAAFTHLRRHQRTSDVLFAFAEIDRLTVRAGTQAEVGSGQYVSGDYWRGLGLAPAAGRLLDSNDDRPEADPAAVLSHDYWQRRFGGSATVVGAHIALNNVAFTVVGVAPRGFGGSLDVGTRADILVPVAMQPRLEPSQPMLADAGAWWLRVMARRTSSVREDAARADLARVFDQYVRSVPQTSEKRRDLPRLVARDGSLGLTDRRETFAVPLQILGALAAIVFLVACTNVAGLLLSRGAARAREMSMRLALGAGRWRLVRQLMTESAIIASLGASLGLLFALWLRGLLVAVIHDPNDTFVVDLGIDVRMVLVTALASLVACVVSGSVAALRATRVQVFSGLKGAAGGTGRPRARLGKTLVGVQVALALPLLVGAGLFVRTVHNLEHQRLGFDAAQVLIFRVDAEMDGYDATRRHALFTRILDRLAALPGVTAAGFSRHRLIANSAAITTANVPGAPAPAAQSEGSDAAPAVLGTNLVWIQVVGGRFFEALRMSLVAGRAFDVRDRSGSRPVAIVNQTLAKRFFGDQNPIGRAIALDQPGRPGSLPLEIIGVMKDARYDNLRRPIPPTIFLPYEQDRGLLSATFEVRVSGDPLAIASSVRKTVAGVDANVPVADVRTQAEQIARATARVRGLAQAATLFGVLALLLACIGLYVIMSYAVARRTSEIGIRIALGARRATVIGGILRESLVLVAAGLIVGGAIALAAARLVAAQLFGLAPRDPLTLVSAAALLTVVALAAAYIPARRASLVDPLTALRHE